MFGGEQERTELQNLTTISEIQLLKAAFFGKIEVFRIKERRLTLKEEDEKRLINNSAALEGKSSGNQPNRREVDYRCRLH